MYSYDRRRAGLSDLPPQIDGGYRHRKYEYVCRGFKIPGDTMVGKDTAEAIYTGKATIRDISKLWPVRSKPAGTWWWNVRSDSWSDVSQAKEWAAVQEGLGYEDSSAEDEYLRAMAGELKWPISVEFGLILVAECPEHWRFDDDSITEVSKGERIKLLDVWYESGRGRWRKAPANFTVRT